MINIIKKIKAQYDNRVIKRYIAGRTSTANGHTTAFEYAFTTSDGKRWYRYKSELEIPIERYEQATINLLELESRINRQDLLDWLGAVEKIINQLIDSPQNKQAYKNLLYLVMKLKDRLELLYAPEIMFRFISAIHIREDQLDQHHIWDKEMEDEKFNQLINDKKSDMYLFFCQAGVIDYLPNSDKYIKEKDVLLKGLMQQEQMFRQMIKEIGRTLSSTSEPK